MKAGINPVTIRPTHTQCSYNVTIGRLHVQKREGGQFTKFLTVAMWDSDDLEHSMVMTVLDEDLFIDALGHLFPRGELAEAHMER
jgi:hypothetical protein